MSEEPVDQIPASDWTDMDLLTRELAAALLDREIAAELVVISQTQSDPSLSKAQRAASMDLRIRRIDAMRQRRDDLADAPAPRFDLRD